MRPDDLEPMSGALQSLLDAERGASGVPSAARDRLLQRLGSEILTGAVAGTAVASATSQAAPLASASASTVATVAAPAAAGIAQVTVVKWLVGVGVAAFAAGGAVGVGVVKAIAPEVKPAVITAPPAPVQPVQVQPSPPVPVEAPPMPAAPRAPVVAPPVKTTDALGIERSLLEQARTALSRGNAADALNALDEHEKKFPQGQMAEERAAMQVLTLKAMGRLDEARSRAEAFRVRYPKGLFRASVDSAVSEL